jgi:hypothetical protein
MNGRPSAGVLCVLLMTSCVAVRAAAPLTLVADGKAKATIVVPKEADALTTRTGADVQTVFAKMTGVKLAIATDDGSVSGNRVLIGQTRWTDAVVSDAERASLGEEGYILRRRGGDLVLVGGGPYGVAYAASELFHRLGARWYLPGPLGEVIPKHDVIAFDELEVRQTPSFAMRWVGTDTDWNLRNRTNRIEDKSLPPAFRVEPRIYHSQEYYIPHRKYYKKHPEYFAQIGGKRLDHEMAKLCNANPEVARELARRMAEVLKSKPGTDLISLSPTDGQRWCECDACRALDERDVPKDQKYSRRQMVLYNRVAEQLEKTFPNQKILVGAYNVYTWPPKDPAIKAHRNLAVIICHYAPYCLAHPVNDPNCGPNVRYRELIGAWQKHMPHVYFYEYYYKANWMSLPWPIVGTIAADIPYFKQIGVEGLYTQYTPGCIWSDFLAHYVAAQLLWDHMTDVDALLEEFYVKFYGRAAGPMKAYYEAMERQMHNPEHHMSGNAVANGPKVFTPQVLETLAAHLDEAQRLAEDDLVKRRLERMACSFEYTRRFMHVVHTADKAAEVEAPQRKRALLQEALDAAVALDKDLRQNGAKYRGIATRGYFKPERMFGRFMTSLKKQIKGLKE